VVKVAVPLVEREVEIARLVEALDLARHGSGRAVSIEGSAGIGKTSLLRTAVDLAEADGTIVLEAAAGPIEREFPLGVARQLFERLLIDAAPAEREALLEGAAGLAAPALGLDATARPDADPSYGLLHGLYWLVANLAAERPLVLAVDDVQWADRGSLRFLAYLGRRLADLPVLLLMTRRTGEPEEEPLLLAELASGPDAALIAPPPLTEVGTRKLLDAELREQPSPELVDRFHTATAGNPFLLHELVLEAAVGEDPLAAAPVAPGSVARSIVARLNRLGPTTAALAEATVILGDGCSLVEAGALAGMDTGAAAEAAAGLVRAEILAREEALRFVHPLVRAAIEREMTPSELTDRHGRAALLLMRRGAERDRIVAQLLAGTPGEDPEAAAHLLAAGREALARGAPGTAARYLRRALEESPAADDVGELLADLGVALMLTDRPAEAAAALGRARELTDDPDALADRTLNLWFALLADGKVEAGVELIEQTIARLGDGAEARDAVLMLEGESVTAAVFDPALFTRAWRRMKPFELLPGDTAAERRLLALTTIRSQCVADLPAADLLEIAERSYGGGRLIDENPLDPIKWTVGVAVFITTDRIPEAEAALARALASARATGSLETLLGLHDLRSYMAFRLGRLEEAEAEALEGLARLEEADEMQMREFQRVGLVRLATCAMVARDRVEEADLLVAENGFGGELPHGLQQARVHRERGLIRLAQGRDEEALEEALRLGEFNRRYGVEDVCEAPWRPIAAQAQANLGNAEAARKIADAYLDLARRWSLPRDVGAALRARALAESEAERRLDLLRQSLAALKSAPAPLETAQTQAELGRALLRAGQRAEAREALGQALDGATRCGAVALAARVRDDLTVAGARPRRDLVSGVDALTAAERRCAGMAATGLTNREIAQSLFLSVRTVENTLSRVYRKLDIASRRDLAPALGETLAV
jgi:DNA-binding CsgD family transcriptional regulator